MKDPIERQDAIDAVENITSSMSVCINRDECHGMRRMQRRAVIALEDLLPAQLEPWWIPCYPSDLPKNMELWVTHDNKYYRWVDTVHWDMTTWSDDVSDVVAYMPYIVPKPYKEGDQDETD